MSELNEKSINYGNLNRFLQDLRSHDLSDLEDKIDNIDIPEYSAGNGISISGDTISCTYEYTLPTATNSTLGGVKVGSGLSISNDVLETDVKSSDIYNVRESIKNQLDVNSIPGLKEYLTLEAKEDNCSIYFGTYDSSYTKTIEISTDKINWIEKTSTRFTSSSSVDGTLLATLNTGDILYIRGDNSAYATGSSNMNLIYATKQCYIYGNIMSLISKDNFWEVKEVTAFALWGLFSSILKSTYPANLYSHPTKKIFLSANILNRSAYKHLFDGTNVTKLVLLATNIGNDAVQYLVDDGVNGVLYKSPLLSALPTGTPPSGWTTVDYYNSTEEIEYLLPIISEKANKVDFVIPVNMQTQVTDWTVLNNAAEGIYRVKVVADMMGTSVTMLEGWATVTNSMGTIAQTLVLTQMIPSAQGSPLTIHNRVSVNNGTTWSDYEFNLGVINDSHSSTESTYSSNKIESLISALETRIAALENPNA